MKLNLVNVINEVINENESEILLVDFYSRNTLLDHYKDMYEFEMHGIRMRNRQTSEMIDFYMSRYGYEYTLKNVNAHYIPEPTFEQWLKDYRTRFILG